MNNNLTKEDVSSTCLPSCLSQPVFDVDPDMPTLSLDLSKCGNPQNLASRKRKFKVNLITEKWSNESATCSEEESSHSSPPPLYHFNEDDEEPFSSCLSPKTHTDLDLTLPAREDPLLEETNGLKKQTPVPSVHLTDVLPSRRSTRIKFQLRKSSGQKNRLDGCCTSDGGIPFPAKRRIRKTKSKQTSFRDEKFVSGSRITELIPLCHVDNIDGFTISSFATFEDLDRYYAEQLPMHANAKITPNCRVEACSTRRCASPPEWLHFGLAKEESMPSDHSTVVPAEVRCSVKTKIPLRKHNLRKRRFHRYSTSASSSFPNQGSMCSKMLVNDLPGECDNLCQIDEIDGFRISSFATSEDIDKFCEHQFLTETQLKTIHGYEISSAERYPVVPESSRYSVPDECRSMIMPIPLNSSSSSQWQRVNPNVEVQPKPSSNRQKPVYNSKHFPANRRYTEKRYILIRLKRKIKDLKNQLSKAHKEGEA